MLVLTFSDLVTASEANRSFHILGLMGPACHECQSSSLFPGLGFYGHTFGPLSAEEKSGSLEENPRV